MTNSAEECQQLCQNNDECVAFTWIDGTNMDIFNMDHMHSAFILGTNVQSIAVNKCHLKNGKSDGIYEQYHVSGPKYCGKFNLIISVII